MMMSGRYVMALEVCFIMAETEPTQTEQETKTAVGERAFARESAYSARSAQDLQIEQLNKRLDSIEATYQARIKELEEANRGLWAQLHPVTQPVPEPTVTLPEAPQEDKAEAALFDALGMKKE